MPAKKRSRSNSKQVYIICAIVTLAVLGVIFGIHKYKIAQIAPVYQIRVDGLDAATPAEAQAACRAAYTRFAEKHSGCAWVWAGKKTLYLVRPETLEIDTSAEETGFTAVSFLNASGKRLHGFIIDPATEPVELGRIKINDAKEYNYDNVSMTVRVGLRSGDIKYENLWEKDTDIVLAVRPDTYKKVEGSIVSFTDDGNVTHTCYVLDTEI